MSYFKYGGLDIQTMHADNSSKDDLEECFSYTLQIGLIAYNTNNDYSRFDGFNITTSTSNTYDISGTGITYPTINDTYTAIASTLGDLPLNAYNNNTLGYVQVYNNTGAHTIDTTNTNSMNVILVGGGGAGGGTHHSANSSGRGGTGGGAGGLVVTGTNFRNSKNDSIKTQSINSVTLNVGAGGNGVSRASGNAGGATNLAIGAANITASGGGGGHFGWLGNYAGGAGGGTSNNYSNNDATYYKITGMVGAGSNNGSRGCYGGIAGINTTTGESIDTTIIPYFFSDNGLFNYNYCNSAMTNVVNTNIGTWSSSLVGGYNGASSYNAMYDNINNVGTTRNYGGTHGLGYGTGGNGAGGNNQNDNARNFGGGNGADGFAVVFHHFV